MLECTNCCNSPKIHKSFFWVIRQHFMSKTDLQVVFSILNLLRFHHCAFPKMQSLLVNSLQKRYEGSLEDFFESLTHHFCPQSTTYNSVTWIYLHEECGLNVCRKERGIQLLVNPQQLLIQRSPNISSILFPTHPFSKVIYFEFLSGHCIQLEVLDINCVMNIALFIGSRHSAFSLITLHQRIGSPYTQYMLVQFRQDSYSRKSYLRRAGWELNSSHLYADIQNSLTRQACKYSLTWGTGYSFLRQCLVFAWNCFI